MLVIIRGLPGSGKSTLAKRYAKKGFIHLENDMYFTKHGRYHWDANEMPHAIAWCEKETEKLLNDGKDVVVSNVFTKIDHMRNYFEMAHKRKIPVTILTKNEHYGSTHDVPKEVIIRMQEEFEEYGDQEYYQEYRYNINVK